MLAVAMPIRITKTVEYGSDHLNRITITGMINKGIAEQAANNLRLIFFIVRPFL